MITFLIKPQQQAMALPHNSRHGKSVERSLPASKIEIIAERGIQHEVFWKLLISTNLLVRPLKTCSEHSVNLAIEKQCSHIHLPLHLTATT